MTLLALLACTDYNIQGTSEATDQITDDRVPDIVVTPMNIDFGALEVGSGAQATEIVTISNEGEGDLHLTGISINDPDAPYSLLPVSSVLVPPGQSADFGVVFAPETALSYPAVAYIESDDPDEPTVEVTLNGDGIAPIIDVSPQEYDFGQLYIGCDNLQPLVVSNIGNDNLEVTAFTYNTGSEDLFFDMDEEVNGALPWSLSPGAEVEVWIDYAPLDEYQDVAYLMVDSNDPFSPTFMATQTGLGALYGENTDVFEQPIKGATDILFALDWSCSMYDDIANVKSNFSTFVSTLASLDSDYHVAVVTEDDGCINGYQPYIDNTMPLADQTDLFDTMVCEQPAGNYCSSAGSNTERAFMLLEAALKTANIGSGGCNEAFYREDATLAVIGVSDEPEQSVNPYTYYVSLFQSMKDDSDDVVMHAIGGDYPQGCGGNQAYTGMYEATVATGGLFLSICATDFGSHLEELAEGSTTDLTSFELSDYPVPETIEVVVNGFTTTTGWSYNAVDNSIDFEDDYVPEGGSTIEVDYALQGDCDA